VLSFLKASAARFDTTLLACHAAVYRYARSLSRDPALAEELVQEAYRKALAAVGRPAPPTEENTRAWLFTIVRNLWHNEVRQRNRWANSGLELDEMPTGSESLETQLTRKLLQSEVRHAIDALPEVFREVVLLRDFEGLSYAEIAQVLGCPAGTVMSRLARAREALRRVLCAPADSYRSVRLRQ
jgi:RNA polymerase sigma-70 factor (ECF subfamily)